MRELAAGTTETGSGAQGIFVDLADMVGIQLCPSNILFIHHCGIQILERPVYFLKRKTACSVASQKKKKKSHKPG